MASRTATLALIHAIQAELHRTRYLQALEQKPEDDYVLAKLREDVKSLEIASGTTPSAGPTPV